MGKKRKFAVQVQVLDLTAVPYMTGVFFFKAKHSDHAHTSTRLLPPPHADTHSHTYTHTLTSPVHSLHTPQF